MRPLPALLLLLVALAAAATEDELESKATKCPKDKVNKKQLANLKKYTAKKPNGQSDLSCPCWWDLTRNNCACCRNGGKQCGFPMHKYCQSPKSARKVNYSWFSDHTGHSTVQGLGCVGIPNYKFTLSSRGFPCYFDLSRTDCAWCKNKQRQCGDDRRFGPDSDCGSACVGTSAKEMKKCDSQLGDCVHIPKYDFAASCIFKTKKVTNDQFILIHKNSNGCVLCCNILNVPEQMQHRLHWERYPVFRCQRRPELGPGRPGDAQSLHQVALLLGDQQLHPLVPLAVHGCNNVNI